MLFFSHKLNLMVSVTPSQIQELKNYLKKKDHASLGKPKAGQEKSERIEEPISRGGKAVDGDTGIFNMMHMAA